ncbi:mechanosensitive ion channel family protein [Variovorax paradoxus]|uniref:mechanosensitive ion channel family protein n=1 Tax=Variovorax paradoxus TaxID=34073 RepID=UPI00247FBA80|nr:mechanosensitive ion channel family protein [Variovorax paradoxus]WGT62611.1 mechanosensitive ion channel family protein [Variovorax paradoxus]
MNERFEALADTTLLGLPARDVALAIAAALAAYLAMRLVLRYVIGRTRQLAQRTSNHVDDMVVDVLGSTNRVFLLLAALLVGVGMLDLSERWNQRVEQLWFIALALQIGLWFTKAISLGLRRYEERHSSSGMTQVSASAVLLSWSLRTLLWAVVLLAVLSNLGVNITAFVASLGVGGIAIALAVQNILGDLFASLSIAVDKPFEVGDAIGIGDLSGTVQHIGLKTTRLRSLTGEQIVISNTDLLKQVVKNYRRMDERRIAFKFGMSYRSDPEKLEAVPGIVKRLIESRPKLRLDRVHFQAFGESSLDFEVVYFVTTPDYGLYMDEQQRLNLQMMREFDALGLEFALPARSVYVTSDGGNSAEAGQRGPRIDDAPQAPRAAKH